MNTAVRLQQAKKSAIETLKTMGTYDYIAVIAFEKEATVLGSFDTLIIAT